MSMFRLLLAARQAGVTEWPLGQALWWHFGRLGVSPDSPEALAEAEAIIEDGVPISLSTFDGGSVGGVDPGDFTAWSDGRLARKGPN